MKDSLISIVVPIYNVEKYLDRCVNSLINQTYKNLEIILVDDGSPDNSPVICEKLREIDNRIKVIHKKNAGLGMARNSGLDIATGEYILFIDSDDYISLDTVEKTLSVAKKYDSDIVMFGMSSIDSAGRITSVLCPKLKKENYCKKEILEFILPNMIAKDPKTGRNLGLNMSGCASLFSMKLIRETKWHFVSEREYISEDFYSLLSLYRYVENFSVINESYYYYYYNNSSLTHTYKKEKYLMVKKCGKAMIENAMSYEYPISVENNLKSQYLGTTIAIMKLILTSTLLEKEKLFFLQEIVEDEFLQQTLISLNKKNESFQRKMMIFLIRNKMFKLIYFLIKLKK